jgi:predicted permease
MSDLRVAVRHLLRSPGFSAVAVVMLALGLGLNAGIFSVFKGITLRPLAGVPHSRDLVTLLWSTRAGDKLTLSYVELREFQQRVRTLSALEGSNAIPFSLDDHGAAQRVWGEYVTGGHHALLGAKPLLGRMLQPEDDRFPGAPVVAVISHRYWKSHFAGDSSIVGRAIRLNGQPCTVVGVAEPGFVGTTVGFGLDVFVPVGAAERLHSFGGSGTEFFTNRGWRSLAPVGRLRPGISLEQARSEIATIGRALAREHPAEYEGQSATLVTLRDSPFGAQTYVAPIFGMMLGMTALVLLITCANLANLLLARAAARTHEIAIRLALGAGRLRLVRQFLTESLLLALIGGGFGALLASATPEFLRSVWPDTQRVPLLLNAETDGTVLVFTLVASLASAVLFGLLPAVQCSRASVLPALKAGPTSHAAVGTWGRNLLVIAQIAVSIPLLITAGLLLRSAQRQQQADFGFEERRIALLSVDLRPNGYDEARGRDYCERVQREVRRLPGVEAVSLANQLPLQLVPRQQSAVEVPGYNRPRDESSLVLLNVITPDYFATLGIRLIAGREFTAMDRENTARVAIINETMARRFWPRENPLGRTFKAYGAERQVVGIARDVKYLTPAEPARPHFYLPQNQSFSSDMIVQVRTAGEPRLILKSVLDRLAQVDPNLPVFGVQTMDEYLEFSLSLPTFAARGLLLAGMLGLTLTALGVYATVSYTVSLRTREIGVRMALGAESTDVVRLVARQGLWLAAIGGAIGLGGAAASTRILGTLLFETSAIDPVTFGLVLVLVAATTLLACWLPVRRATHVDPIKALRAE